ncbi:VRR-NUC domain-containing protein [Burkholderia seminalis]|uniref:VRR-NUC domain-containing protein n=1 Tax=Burkholderia seminalis TaxID=488731 RepID=UPI001905B7CA|nr:VRR-NUC domain-containing protein [Burkholderia seminalis]MBJ9965182.1 VRR-NUC domain-containing protein [Burkholderia seminalis]
MTPASPTPPAFYYLTNFERALAWLGERYDDLFDVHEHAFVRQFATLPQPSRALLVRMLMRSGSDFRASKLVYDEIGCTLDAAAPLVALGWVDPAPALTLDALFALSTKADLLHIFPSLSAHAGERKPEWLERLRPAYDGIAQPLDAWCAQADDRVLRVTVGALCDRLRLMFFGNLHQDWSEFVLADLGVFQYESVPIAPSSRAFQQRGDVDAYLALQTCRDALDAWPDDLPFDDLTRAIDAIGCAQPWLATRRAKLMFALGQTCERRADWDAALDAYARSAWPGSRHRRIRVLERCGRDADALALALDARAGFESDEERQRVERMLPRLLRRAGQRVERPAAAADVPRETLVLARPDAFVSVEFAVRDHLAQPAAPVHYVENTLINSLFGLLCWEPVFAAVPGAFFHPFQRGPADLHAPDFAARRADAFDACFAQLDSGAYRDTIRRHFATKAGLQSPFVFWGVLTDALLEEALACLPPEHLRLWFARLLEDIRGNRSGLPDLIRFWPDERRYELIEVKGPGDRLQDNQIRWLAYCVAHGMPVRVVDVAWAGDGVTHAEAVGLSA